MDKKTRKVIRSAILAAIIFLSAYVLKVPVSNGYVHPGDGILLFAAAVMPLSDALPAAMIGFALADLMSGFAMYLPATILIKGLMALTMGTFCRRKGFFSEKMQARDILTAAVGGILAGAVNVGGYFAAELILYGLGAAAVDVIANVVQAAVGIAVMFLLAPAAQKINRNL